MGNVELLSRGMRILNRELGSIDAERFISVVLQEQFDYTKWQREYFDAMSPEEFGNEAAAYATTHPFRSDVATII